ncbi:DUF2934 domain-containing protein, partial [bacterium]|nr:DUF2934 domain-containing protein [bacterium]
EIANMAYELYINSGYIEGRDEENWLEAERIILARQRLEPEEQETKKKQVMRSKGKKNKKDESNIA